MKKTKLFIILSLLSMVVIGFTALYSVRAEEKLRTCDTAQTDDAGINKASADPNIYPLWSDVYDGGMDYNKDHLYVWNGLDVRTVENSAEAYAGTKYMKIRIKSGVTWFGMGLHLAQAADLSAFQNGLLRFAIKIPKSTTDLKILIKHSGNVESWLDIRDGQYGYKKDDQWHVVSIPISTWTPQVNMKKVSICFGLSQGNQAYPRPGTFYLDEIYFIKN
ncbi:MAG: hypothetical protein JW822_05825 [Spirochaetales bacterium]|nr:hypothetical protein [Spirochaetales bacterium]